MREELPVATGVETPGRQIEAERQWARRREFKLRLAVSVGAHILLGVALVIAPASARVPLPRVITLDLVKMAAPRRAAARAPKPAPAPVVAKKIVLPKQPAKLPVAPKKVAPKKVVRKPPKREELDYDDALAKLRSELGEKNPPTPDPDDEEPIPGPEPSGASGGVYVDPVVLAWMKAVDRHVKRVWVTPQEFLDRRLTTGVRVLLSLDGKVVGNPEVVRSSGDPFFDDNAVRAMLRASPVPRPPSAGEWIFSFAP